MRDSVHVTLVENPDTLWPRRSEWNALVERSATNTVFQTLEWHCSWWKALGGGSRPLILLAEAAGKMVGIAPLMLSEQRLFGRRRRVVEFIGTHAADYCDFVADASQPEIVTLLLQRLIDHADRWDLLHLINIAETSPLLNVLPRFFGERGYAADLQRRHDCPTRVFGDRAADLGLLRKRDIRKKDNELRAQGELEFRLYREAAEIEPLLDAFFQQHIDRWTSTPTPSFFHDERQREFYRQLVRLLAANKWVVFSVVWFNRVPISFHFGYEYGTRVYFIKPTFDPQYAEYAPGMLHIKYVIEYALQHGLKELDFTVGEERFKFRFANHARSNYAARVHAHSMFYGIDRLLLHAKALARRSPAVTRLGGRIVRPLLGDTLHRLGL